MKDIIRIIPVLFIKNGLIVRKKYEKHQFIGNVIEQAKGSMIITLTIT